MSRRHIATFMDGDAWGPGTIKVWNIPPIDPLKAVEIQPE